MSIIRFTLIAVFCSTLAACSGSDDPPAGGVVVTTQSPIDIKVYTFKVSIPNGFSEVSRNDFNFRSGVYQPQTGQTIVNADNSIRCRTAAELGENLSLETVNAQIASSREGSIVSVENIEKGGFRGQETVISSGDSAEENLDIARHYFIPANRFFLGTDEAAVFYFRCTTPSVNYSENESVMRSILDSGNFLSQP